MQLEIPAAIENIDEIMAIYAAEEKVGIEILILVFAQQPNTEYRDEKKS